MQKEVIKKECIEAIDKIFNEYNDDMVFNRIKQYISNQMPVVIKNYSNQQMEKTTTAERSTYVQNGKMISILFFLEAISSWRKKNFIDFT